MSLRDLMAAHAAELTRTDHNGETATYRFHNGDPDRTVQVVVDRQALSTLGADEVDSVTIQEATVFIPYSTTIGVTTIDEGDTIELPIRYGNPAVVCRIAEELSSGPNGFLVRVVA